MKFFISVIGMVMIIEGLPYFLSPDKAKAWMVKIQEIPGDALRLFGLIMMAAGLFLVYFGRS